MNLSKYLLILAVLIMVFHASMTNAGTVLLLKGSFPESSKRFYGELNRGMISAGYTVEETGATRLAERLAEVSGPGNILVLPNARYFPVDAAGEMQAFLKRGNHLMAISGPMFEKTVQFDGQRWFTKNEAVNGTEPLKGTTIIDFAKQGAASWQRAPGTPGNRMEFTIGPSGSPDFASAIHINYSNLESWEMLNGPSIFGTVPKGSHAIAFRTTSESDTDMGIQFQEKDASRWIANVKIPKGSKRFVLTESDFNIWRDRIPPGRAGANDHLHLDNTANVSFIFSHDNDKSNKRTFSISDFQALEGDAIFSFVPPVLESISPFYKLYRTQAVTGSINDGTAFPVNAEVVCPNPRCMAYGSDTVRKWRMIPIMQVFDKSGEQRGFAAHLFMNTSTEYAGSIWGYVGLSQETLDKDSTRYVPMVVSMLDRMARGIFLTNAGSEHFAYADGESTKYGAYVTNLGKSSINADVRFTIRSKRGKILHTSDYKVTLTGNDPRSPLYTGGQSITLPPGEYRISTVLNVDGQTIDEITYPFQVIKYSKLSEKDRVTVRDGKFYLHGKEWYGQGINYWPTASAGLENLDYYGGHWLDPDQYNPEIVEKDLALAHKLGMTLFSVQYLLPRQTRAFMDFLARAEKYDIMVNCFIDGLHPMGINMLQAPSDWKDHSIGERLIRDAHLAESPAVFAYDVGWEVHVGHDTDRQAYDRNWQDWVIDRYGSIENAERDWAYSPKRIDGVITGPSDAEITSDGPWKVYVAAYRRFWDDRISEGYRAMRSAVKSADPVHLIGARSGYGGTGSLGITARFPYDLASGVKHLDFTSPEAYTLSGPREEFLQGGFTAAYARLVSGGKPVYWAEYGVPAVLGVSVPDYNHGKTPEDHKRQADFVRNMMELCYETHSNASAGWWWPGGFRISEQSDFGIVNPDGTPREAALEMQKASKRLNASRKSPRPDSSITIDRDQSTFGYSGIYRDLAPRFGELLADGKFPGLKTDGTDTTSVNTPLTAVGNRPYNGHNPPKYLNAEFNWLMIPGVLITNGITLGVQANKPVYIEASIGNTGEASWIAPKNGIPGEVYLLAESENGNAFLPIDKDTPSLGDAQVHFKLTDGIDKTTTFAFRMAAKDRAMFGEVLKVTLVPEM